MINHLESERVILQEIEKKIGETSTNMHPNQWCASTNPGAQTQRKNLKNLQNKFLKMPKQILEVDLFLR